MFFNARDTALSDGGSTVVGRATTDDGGFTWITEDEPALIDSAYAAVGSAVAVEHDEVLLFYSFDTRAGFGVARSKGGRPFLRVSNAPLITPAHVNCSRVGLPYVTANGDGWIMVFEGLGLGTRRFSVYSAYSDDLWHWELLTPRPLITSDADWHANGQANPSLHRAAHADRAYLLYNGSPASMEWDVGMARSLGSGITEWETLDSPILSRTKDESWSRQRLEGARPFPAGDALMGLVYFGTPSAEPFAGGTIGIAVPTDE